LDFESLKVGGLLEVFLNLNAHGGAFEIAMWQGTL